MWNIKLYTNIEIIQNDYFYWITIHVYSIFTYRPAVQLLFANIEPWTGRTKSHQYYIIITVLRVNGELASTSKFSFIHIHEYTSHIRHFAYWKKINRSIYVLGRNVGQIIHLLFIHTHFRGPDTQLMMHHIRGRIENMLILILNNML